MDAEKLLEILGVAGKLRENTRHNWITAERQESVADHSYRISLLALLLSGEEEFRGYDMNRVIRMCLIHDLGEAFTGDIPTFNKTEEDAEREASVMERWVEDFPEPQRTEWRALLSEMGKLSSREAKLYKALDRLEAVISHNEADIRSWLPLEYELQKRYGEEDVQFSPYLRRLKAAIDAWTDRKIREEA